MTMSYASDGITRVRARPLALDLAADGAPAGPAALEVAWESIHADRCHQVYVNGHLAGVTAQPADARLVVSPPAGAGGPGERFLVEVVAVPEAERWTDFAASLAGFGPGAGAHVRLAWQAGVYLDAGLEAFDVFADGRTGAVDYATPLNDAPLPALPGGLAPWGYGCGGYGVGAYGAAAARFEWTTDPLEPGTWRFAVVAVDAAGNRLAQAAEVAIEVAPLPRLPGAFRVAAYDAPTRTATLAWDSSPDL